MQFTFIIKDGKYNSYKKIAASILLLNAFIFLFASFSSIDVVKKNTLISTAMILAAYSIYFWKFKKKNENSFIAACIFASLVWIFVTPSWYFALLYVLLSIIQFRIEKKQSITISKEQVSIQSFIPSKHKWTELSNAVLKGGLLTLDFKNNKILQVEPDWQMSAMNKEYADLEKDFNEFCKQQLIK